MRFLPDGRDATVAVVGLGYVGACLAGALAGNGLDVIGVDTNTDLVDELNRGECRFHENGLAPLLRTGVETGRLTPTTDYARVREADVVVIAVGTPVQADGSLDSRQLTAACTTLAEHVRPGQLFVLKSTVPPGTTRELVRPLLERSGHTAGVDFGLAFTPERLAEGTAIRELSSFPIAVGGLTAASAEAAAAFWGGALKVPTIPLQSLEAAEIVKLADNWWIDLNIAMANELAKFCALYDADVLEVIHAANSIPKGNGNINILTPSVGVGGSCLTKDPWMVWRSAKDRGVDILTAPTGREVNAAMPAYTARLALDELASLGKEAEDVTVAVLGLAFKNNTGDLRFTPVAGTVAELRAAGATVRLHDPLVDVAEAERIFGGELTASLEDAVRDADCIAVLALHDEFKEIDFSELEVAPKCLLLDGRAHYPAAKVQALRDLGYIYRGIGR